MVVGVGEADTAVTAANSSQDRETLRSHQTPPANIVVETSSQRQDQRRLRRAFPRIRCESEHHVNFYRHQQHRPINKLEFRLMRPQRMQFIM